MSDLLSLGEVFALAGLDVSANTREYRRQATALHRHRHHLGFSVAEGPGVPIGWPPKAVDLVRFINFLIAVGLSAKGLATGPLVDHALAHIGRNGWVAPFTTVASGDVTVHWPGPEEGGVR